MKATKYRLKDEKTGLVRTSAPRLQSARLLTDAEIEKDWQLLKNFFEPISETAPAEIPPPPPPGEEGPPKASGRGTSK